MVPHLGPVARAREPQVTWHHPEHCAVSSSPRRLRWALTETWFLLGEPAQSSARCGRIGCRSVAIWLAQDSGCVVESSETSFEVDGLKCAATLYRPASVEAPVACVVMGQGFSLTRRDGIPDYAERFAAVGLASLAFDYRYWGEVRASRVGGSRYAGQIGDWRAAVMFARGLEGVDPDRIAVWGMSMGGGHALTTAATDPRIAGVVAVVPIADGLAVMLQPAPPRVEVWLIGRVCVRRSHGEP